jgi:hypothetical protein
MREIILAYRFVHGTVQNDCRVVSICTITVDCLASISESVDVDLAIVQTNGKKSSVGMIRHTPRSRPHRIEPANEYSEEFGFQFVVATAYSAICQRLCRICYEFVRHDVDDHTAMVKTSVEKKNSTIAEVSHEYTSIVLVVC